MHIIKLNKKHLHKNEKWLSTLVKSLIPPHHFPFSDGLIWIIFETEKEWNDPTFWKKNKTKIGMTKINITVLTSEITMLPFLTFRIYLHPDPPVNNQWPKWLHILQYGQGYRHGCVSVRWCIHVHVVCPRGHWQTSHTPLSTGHGKYNWLSCQLYLITCSELCLCVRCTSSDVTIKN